MELQRNCLACGDKLRGRSDKKFCNESCRNHFHNLVNASQSEIIREINKGLRRNRSILHELIQEGIRTIKRSRLSRKGFDFDLITAIEKRRSGNLYYCCYEFGYMPIDENRIHIIQRSTKSYI